MLKLKPNEREQLWQQLIDTIEDYERRVEELPVSPRLDIPSLRAAVAEFDFTNAVDTGSTLNFVAEMLRANQVHTPHPRYFGLFNPNVTTAGIAADTLVAAFNPQLASYSHSPFAIEVENHLIRAIGERFGYARESIDGTFASGGMEANHTAVLAALTHSFPEFGRKGLLGLMSQPVLYVTAEGHHSFQKAARLCGLGTDAVREIALDDDLRMNVDALRAQIDSDKANGFAPFMVVATAGTTNSGIVDSIPEVIEVAREHGLWAQIDAAWGGGAAFVPELSDVLAGIERSDSITFDAHKWLSVPMGAGMFITRHADILARTFRIENAYMPKELADDIVSPYAHSMQWSRRFIGLKVFMSLAVAGWRGYEDGIRHQTAMGDLMRVELGHNGWIIANQTRLPVVCFVDSRDGGNTPEYLSSIAKHVQDSGVAWISTTRLGDGRTVLRACITNYETQPNDIAELIHALDNARLTVTREPTNR